jgi:hypothetical protein
MAKVILGNASAITAKFPQNGVNLEANGFGGPKEIVCSLVRLLLTSSHYRRT